MREVRDASLGDDPFGAGGDGRKRRAGLGQLVDAERQHLGLERCAIEVGGQLAARDHQHRVGFGARDQPVVGDHEDVAAEGFVVRDELGGRRLTVRLVRVAVQLATQPLAGSLKGIHACDRSMLIE